MNRNNNPEDALIRDLLADRRTPLVERILENNQVIKHNFRTEQVRKEICHLEGCDQTFEFTLIPHQVVYPKFCVRHRSEFQRKSMLESLSEKDNDEPEKPKNSDHL